MMEVVRDCFASWDKYTYWLLPHSLFLVVVLPLSPFYSDIGQIASSHMAIADEKGVKWVIRY